MPENLYRVIASQNVIEMISKKSPDDDTVHKIKYKIGNNLLVGLCIRTNEQFDLVLKKDEAAFGSWVPFIQFALSHLTFS